MRDYRDGTETEETHIEDGSSMERLTGSWDQRDVAETRESEGVT